MRKPIIAIDGPAATGKSTVARGIADKLDYQFISSGSVYRGIALQVIEKDVDIADSEKVIELAEGLEFTFLKDENGNNITLINGEDVTGDLRKESVGNKASQIATNAAIREVVVKKLHKIGENGGIVMEGRDIQTIVFPDAEVKLFLAASADTRAKRRHEELRNRLDKEAFNEISYDEILNDIKERDERDVTREFSPLKPAKDAVIIDTDDKTIDEVVDHAIFIAHRLTAEAPFDVASRTDMGYVREVNEDGFLIYENGVIMAVADGMGGHDHGEVASDMALKEIAASAPKMITAPGDKIIDAMYLTCQQANSEIYQRANMEDAELKMGTTMVFTLLSEDRLYYLNVGDSRLYLLRNNELTQLTHDHSLVQEMVDNNEITKEEATLHPYRNRITKVVGCHVEVEPDIASIKLVKDDVLLLCTDGLHSVLDETAIKDILTSSITPAEKTNILIDRALEAGGPDNITAIVAQYKDNTENNEAAVNTEIAAAVVQAPKKHKRVPVWSIIITTVIFLAVVSVGAYFYYSNPPRLIKSGADDSNDIYIYKTYPLLIFIEDQRDETAVYPILTIDEVRPYLDRYGLVGDFEDGIIIFKNQETALATIYKLAKDVVAGLINDVDNDNDPDGVKRQRLEELLRDPRLNDEFKGWIEEQHVVKGDEIITDP